MNLSAEIAEAEDPLAVGDDDSLHVVLRPVLQHVVHVPLVVDADKHALRDKLNLLYTDFYPM